MGRFIGFGVFGVLVVACMSAGCSMMKPKATTGKVDVYIFYSPDSKPVHKVVGVSGYPTVLDVTRRVAGVRTTVNENGEQWPVVIGKGAQNVGAGRVWTYELNNGFPNTAPNLKHVGPGDTIIWRLQ